MSADTEIYMVGRFITSLRATLKRYCMLC